MLSIHSDFHEFYDEIDRLIAMPTPRMVGELDAALHLGLETTRARVHVDTGALKASGSDKSKANKNDWQGEFSFGSSAAGPVDYAIYEKERDGGHDFFSQVYLLKSVFVAALRKGLARK